MNFFLGIPFFRYSTFNEETFPCFCVVFCSQETGIIDLVDTTSVPHKFLSEGPFKCYVTQMGVGGVNFSGKKCDEGVRFNVITISVTRGWVGVQFP